MTRADAKRRSNMSFALSRFVTRLSVGDVSYLDGKMGPFLYREPTRLPQYLVGGADLGLLPALAFSGLPILYREFRNKPGYDHPYTNKPRETYRGPQQAHMLGAHAAMSRMGSRIEMINEAWYKGRARHDDARQLILENMQEDTLHQVLCCIARTWGERTEYALNLTPTLAFIRDYSLTVAPILDRYVRAVACVVSSDAWEPPIKPLKLSGPFQNHFVGAGVRSNSPLLAGYGGALRQLQTFTGLPADDKRLRPVDVDATYEALQDVVLQLLYLPSNVEDYLLGLNLPGAGILPDVLPEGVADMNDLARQFVSGHYDQNKVDYQACQSYSTYLGMTDLPYYYRL